MVAPVAEANEDFEEIGHDAEADAIPYIAECAAENEGEGDGCDGEALADFENHAEDDDYGHDGESCQYPARAARCGRFGEKAEGRSGIEHVRDVEIVRDDGDGIAVGDVALDEDFGPAVEGDDERGDDEEPAAAVVLLQSNLLFF